jgi:hypothetical protein
MRYIDMAAKCIKQRILAVRQLSHPHTHDEIRTCVLGVLRKCGVCEKPVVINCLFLYYNCTTQLTRLVVDSASVLARLVGDRFKYYYTFGVGFDLRQPLPAVTGSAKPLKDIVKKEINMYFSTSCASGRGEQVDIIQYWINGTVSTAQNISHPVSRISRTWPCRRYTYAACVYSSQCHSFMPYSSTRVSMGRK